ncbi:ArsO family NAD(P)H-dependent flavin-containing monooxygenase [Sinomicrobium weinanense]|uniref:NAD(P)/FAD-dependent oxidoreductase n=1 Tax=Sinomicrobium weinanense TaxID=2842200 RepID=A0A926JUP1_9FLAO|nr:ArsO family NAD(P)H-dependent flavin-containing monooxygenase [Sinomicrobium weinanense]MBC9797686.1 NAD(P)/FAD-dependent oxidoreductase [Sinomicrobium weinanense]MBU3125803.1 NAD(P)/FAD-dependent oxidoreductase [Sinomicrobium weinanense]
MNTVFDVIVIGGGQSGLATGYYLRRAKLNYLILDDREERGGAWQSAWDSLTLFSPAEHSSLPGWLMPRSEGPFPTRKEVIDYLTRYEERYGFPVQRPVRVNNIERQDGMFRLITTKGDFYARTVVAATGTWADPVIPDIEGREAFKGIQLHSARYKSPETFQGQKVLVVGEGNSGAQIMAEVSKYSREAKWATRKEPEFLPDEVDGHYLFNIATAKYRAEKEGKPFDRSKYNLGNIVVIPSVKEARSRDVLRSGGSFTRMYEEGVVWEDGTREAFDAVIWCTGFGYATSFLRNIARQDAKGIVKTDESRATEAPGLWLVGYGGWTGYASATLIGVNRTARQTVRQIEEYLKHTEAQIISGVENNR